MFGTMTQSSWAMGYVGTYALKLMADGYTYKADKLLSSSTPASSSSSRTG